MASVWTKIWRRTFGQRTKDITEASKSQSASSDFDKSKVRIAKMGLAISDGSTRSRLEFEEPVGFNFEEIFNAYATDSYIRQSVDKYVDFAFKTGWDLVGSNTDAVNYINARFRALELAMGRPIDVFLKEAFKDFCLYQNVFILKNWAKTNYVYPGDLKVDPGMYKKTICSYELMPVDSITIARDAFGNVLKYKQEIEGSSEDEREFAEEDIIHIYNDKPVGRGFGFPQLWEALDDVKLLRQVEGLMQKMIYKNVFPLHVYTVGNVQEGLRCRDGEIDEVKAEMEDLTLDGTVIIPERHKIEIIGAQGKAMDISDYMTYLENRVFTALNVSSTIMGRSDTSNRSTSTNLDQMFKDKVKSNQKVFENFINFYMVKELLAEGGYNFIKDSSLGVSFRFREIDMEAKIAEENHATQLLMQNGITYPEYRKRIGYDPLESYDELYFNVIKSNTSESTAQQKEQAAANSGSNKNSPTNQHGSRPSAKTKKEALNAIFKQMYEAIADNQEITSEFRQRVYRMLNFELQNSLDEAFCEGYNGILSRNNCEHLINKCFLQDLKSFASSNLLDSYNDVLNRDFNQCSDMSNKVFLDLLKDRLSVLFENLDTYSYNVGYAEAAKTNALFAQNIAIPADNLLDYDVYCHVKLDPNLVLSGGQV